MTKPDKWCFMTRRVSSHKVFMPVNSLICFNFCGSMVDSSVSKFGDNHV